MPLGVPTPWVVQGGAAGLLAFAVLAVFLGWLVPRYLVKQMRADLLPWKETAETAIVANRELSEHVGRLVVTVGKLVEAQQETEVLVRALVAATPPSTRREAA